MDYDRSGECAAGTGSFLDQQALRMQYSVEEVGELVCTASCAARIAGRCSVFAKSDMIHAQQKGYSPAEILRGLCDAVARNFKSSIVKGRPVEAPVALIGAVSQNAGVAAALREAFSLSRGRPAGARRVRLVRRHRHGHSGGRGAAQALHPGDPPPAPARCRRARAGHAAAVPPRTSCNCATAWASTCRRPTAQPIPAYLGLDIGSVSTNVVAIDEFGTVIHDVYLRTAGRPIEAVQQGLAEVERLWGSRLQIRGVGTTGSGRELIAEFVGADAVNDEITAHKTGAIHISKHPGRRAGGYDLRNRRPGFQVHLHRDTAWWWISP